VVDQDKKKISKSAAQKAGKPVDAAYFYEKYGADILRLWVSSVDWQNEVPFGEDLFKQTAEPYRRFRNTLRILLANLSDFDAASDAVTPDKLTLLDRWILERLHDVVTECREAYAAFEFRKVFNVLNQFCAVDLSALYVDITKDRMYCDAADAPRRRATQTAMHQVFEALTKLLAPILAFTADEAWEYAGHKSSVHYETFPNPDPAFASKTAAPAIEEMVRLRDLAQVAIDAAVKSDQFKKREQAAVTFVLPKDDAARTLIKDHAEELLEFLMVSTIALDTGSTATAQVANTTHEECPRCRRSLAKASDSELCQRCEDVVAALPPVPTP
jgi:isoleucyl-tRNA synthetase